MPAPEADQFCIKVSGFLRRPVITIQTCPLTSSAYPGLGTNKLSTAKRHFNMLPLVFQAPDPSLPARHFVASESRSDGTMCDVEAASDYRLEGAVSCPKALSL